MKAISWGELLLCSDHTTPSCTKEHFAVQAVPLRWIKASRSIRYAGRSRLAQGKHQCHKSVFWRGNLYCCTWEGKSISQNQLCASLLLARQISARACQRGCTKQRMEVCSPHRHLSTGVCTAAVWAPGATPQGLDTPCQNDHRQPWALAFIPLGIVHAPPPGKPSWFHSSITFSSQKSRRDTWLWPLQVGTTITCCLGVWQGWVPGSCWGQEQHTCIPTSPASSWMLA